MHLINLDPEQLDLVELAAEFYLGALVARQKRMDPQEFITRTLNVSRGKLENIIAQARHKPLLNFSELTDDDRSRVELLITEWIAAKEGAPKDALWTALAALMLSRRTDPDAPRTEDGPGAAALRRTQLPPDAPGAEEAAPTLPGLSPEDGAPASPHIPPSKGFGRGQ